jgi:hypothetical protein
MSSARHISSYLIRYVWTALWLALLIPWTVVYAAEFEFNFKEQQNGATVPGGFLTSGGTTGGNDGSRFIQDRVTIGGVEYWHVVVGDPATGFAIESYVTSHNVAVSSANSKRGGSPDSGGNERALLAIVEPNLKAPGLLGQSNMPFANLLGNSRDPLGIGVSPSTDFQPYDLSGNGTMNPTRMTMRMVVSDSDISLDVFKPLLDRKPFISQTTLDTEMIGRFVVDMRSVSYDTLNKIVPITNTLTLFGSAIFNSGSGDFDMGMAQRSNVTAGQYTFTPGTGWNSADGWDSVGSTFDEGNYTYADGGGGFNVYGIQWENFFDTRPSLDGGLNATFCSSGNRAFSTASCPPPL